MISLKTRLDNFIGVVSFVADKDQQALVWVKKVNNISSIYCLAELYNQFFNDNQIDDFIDNEMENAPLSEAQRIAIRRFRDALNAFNVAPGKLLEKSGSDLIDDLDWNEIVKLAISTKQLFGEFNFE